MRRIQWNPHSSNVPFSRPRGPFYKAFLLGVALIGLAANPASADPWEDFLAGAIDLDAALAADSRDPDSLVAELEIAVADPAGGWDAAARELAVLYIRKRRPEDAIPLLEKVRAQSEDPLVRAFCDLHRGRALVHTRQVAAAARQLDEALQEAEKLQIPLWIGDASIALSVLDRWAMDLDSSLSRRQRALAAYQQIGYLKGEARAQHYIGTIHVFRGELTLALQTLQGALALARRADFDVEIAGTLADLAGVNFLLGDLERAQIQYEEAERLTDHPWRRGQLANNVGALLADQGRHAEAIPHFEEARELMRQVGDERLQAEILLSLGRSNYELKDFETGVAQLDTAIVLARRWQIPVTEAYALQYKGCAMLDQDRLDEAVSALDQAEILAAQTGFFDLRETCDWARALVERRRGNPQAALDRLHRALAVVSGVRRACAGSSEVQAGYFSQTRKTFDELIDLLYEMHVADPEAGYAEQALDVVQQAKARGFLDQLQEAEVDLRSRADPAIRAREQGLMENIAALEEQADSEARIAELETELKLLEADLRSADPRYAELKYPRSCTLFEAQNFVLRPGELLLEYHLGQKGSYLWAITAQDFEFHRLPPAAELETQVESVLPMLRDYNLLGQDAAYFSAQAGELSKQLLGPVLALVRDCNRVIVAPDGILHTLPFAVLLTEPTSSRDFAALPYLVRSAEVVHAPSLSAVQRMRSAAAREKPVAHGILIVARPRPERVRVAGVFARAAGVERLDAVPFAAEEIAGITASFDPAEVTLLESGDATLENLQQYGATPHRVVHFTTHGLFNPRRPLYSGLVLEPGPESDSLLAVHEIFGLSLPCEQVVLSACSSGLGRNIGGEGLVGMTRAFLYAGAGSVLAALWDVSGSGTATFMAEYYAQQSGDAHDAAAALARTQRRMLAGECARTDGSLTSHPVFWAPFVLTGGF